MPCPVNPGLPADALRMGRIGYLNVLPIYHPLEAGIIPHDFEIISGRPPSSTT